MPVKALKTVLPGFMPHGKILIAQHTDSQYIAKGGLSSSERPPFSV